MTTVTIHAAKTHLSRLLAQVEAGEEIVLARGSQPVAKLVPYGAPAPKRRFGALRGIISVGPEFFEPLPQRRGVEQENYGAATHRAGTR